MPQFESIQTLPTDDSLINDHQNNMALANPHPPGDDINGVGGEDSGTPYPPQEDNSNSYVDLLTQDPDMNPYLRSHVERLAAEQEIRRAEISPEHHQKHIAIAEPIVPDIESRPEVEQDLIGEIIEVGETVIDAEEVSNSPTKEVPAASQTPTSQKLESAQAEDKVELKMEHPEALTASSEERQQAATKWVSEHLAMEESENSSAWSSHSEPKLKFAKDETVPPEYASEVALQLLDSDDFFVTMQFQDHIDKFSNLSEEVVDRLIGSSGSPEMLVAHPEKFRGLVLDEGLAEKLIEAERGYAVVENIESFSGITLNQTFADRLVESGNADAVIEGAEKFMGVELDGQFIDRALRDPRNAYAIASSLDKFPTVQANDELARRIMRIGGPDVVAGNLNSFEGLSNGLAKDLLSDGVNRFRVFSNIEVFPDLTPIELADVLANLNNSGETNVVSGAADMPMEFQSALFDAMMAGTNFDAGIIISFSSLNNEVANRLIADGKASELLSSIDRFPDFKLDLPFAEKLLKNTEGYPGLFLTSIGKFPSELHSSIAQLVISKGWADQLDRYTENGDIKLDESLKTKLKTISDSMNSRINPAGARAYIEAFPDTDVNVLAERLIAQSDGEDYSEYEIENINSSLKNLSGLDKSIAARLLTKGYADLVVNNLDSFSGLDASIAEAIIAAGKSMSVILNPEAFDNFRITAGRAMELSHSESGYGYSLVKTLEYMNPTLPTAFDNELATKLIADNQLHAVAGCFEQFKDLDSSVANELILYGHATMVLDGADHFKDLSELDIARTIISKGQVSVILSRIDSIEGLESIDPAGDPYVERFSELLKDKELIALIGNDGPLNLLSSGFLGLYMHSKDPHAIATQIKSLADGSTALWRINHEYAKLLVGEVGDIGFLDGYKVDSIPLALPRKDIGESISDLPSPVMFSEMDADTRKLVLSQEYIDAHPDIMADTEISFTDLNSDIQDTLLAYRLYETIATTRDESARNLASDRNKSFAESGEYWQEGDLAHATGSVGNLRQILLSGILCGETIGSASGGDSYPFNVDTVAVSSEVLEAQGYEDRMRALKNQEFGDIVLLLHRNSESIDFGKEMQGGMNQDHRLIFGAVPGTEISAVMLRGNGDSMAEEVIDSIIEAGVYMPVVSQKGETILTYEEYQKRRADGNYLTIQPRILDSSFKREGTQGGSNEGAIFMVPGIAGIYSYYVKFGDESALKHNHLWSEILSDRIYRAVTPNLVPDTEAVVVEGRLARASKLVEVAENVPVTNEARNAGFIMDTFLGNWDAVYNPDNLVMTTDGRAMRIDTGNGLDFKARGERKPEGAFSETVSEIEFGTDLLDLRNGMRQKYPELTNEMITSQTRELRDRLPDEMIDALVDSIRRPKAEREELARILKARKQYLIEKFL